MMRLMPHKPFNKQSAREIETVIDEVGERIAQFRKARGLTQVELAHHLAIGQNLVSAYELGKVRIGVDMVIKIARTLKMSTDELLGFKNGNVLEALPSRRILRRLTRFDTLPRRKQDALLQTIDAVLQSAEG